MRELFGRHRSSLVRFASIVFDLSVAIGAFVAAYATVLGFPLGHLISDLPVRIALFVLISSGSYYLFSVHRGSWRYVSIQEILAIIKASTFAVAVYTLAYFLISRGADVPRSVPILIAIYLVAGLSTARLGYRLFVDGKWSIPLQHRSTFEARCVLLVGLNPAAESFVRSTRRLADSPFKVVGIIDDTRSGAEQTLHGVKVYRGLGKLPSAIESLKATGIDVGELVVAETKSDPQRLSRILEASIEIGLRVTRIPNVTNTSSITSASLLETRPVEIGDLLGRPEFRTDVEGVAKLIENNVVLITGAAGSIGSELCRQIAGFRPRLAVITDSSEFHLYELDKWLRQAEPDLSIVTRLVDVRDAARVSSIMSEFRPHIVFHAAALKHVPLVEENPLEGIKTNVFGTINVANAALESEVSAFVMISTDKAVNPTNLMGASKRAAELYCQSLDVTSKTTRFKTVRFGNVLGSNGSVVPRFEEQIAAGGPVTVTHPDIERFFMTIPEAVRLVLHASARGMRDRAQRGKIIVLDMGRPIKIVDLASRMIQLAGFKPNEDIKIVFTGLRPGEKLFEELFDPSEVQEAATTDGYAIASPRLVDREIVNQTLDQLKVLVSDERIKESLSTIRRIVPEFRQNSPAGVKSVEDEPKTSINYTNV